MVAASHQEVDARPAQHPLGRPVGQIEAGAAQRDAIEPGFEQRALAGSAAGDRFLVDPQSWWSALTTVLEDLREVQRAVGADIAALAVFLASEGARNVTGQSWNVDGGLVFD